MAVILPASLTAQDANAAMLRSNGGVLVNGGTVQESSALFTGDTVQTQSKSTARIEATGATIELTEETVAEFDGDELRLDHGSVQVNTSRQFRVRAGCVLVTPVLEEWTRYEVTDVNGKVSVSAIKDDVNIDSRSRNLRQALKPGHSDRVTVHEGEQKSREDKCGGAMIKDASVAAYGAWLNSPWAIGAGLAGIGLICLALCHNDDPLSPSKPK